MSRNVASHTYVPDVEPAPAPTPAPPAEVVLIHAEMQTLPPPRTHVAAAQTHSVSVRDAFAQWESGMRDNGTQTRAAEAAGRLAAPAPSRDREMQTVPPPTRGVATSTLNLISTEFAAAQTDSLYRSHGVTQTAAAQTAAALVQTERGGAAEGIGVLAQTQTAISMDHTQPLTRELSRTLSSVGTPPGTVAEIAVQTMEVDAPPSTNRR